jgi:hypothetical protein
MLREHERAILTVDLPDSGFTAGDVGTIVHVYANSAAYELELMALDGRTLDVITVEAGQVRPVGRGDILHVREWSSELTE